MFYTLEPDLKKVATQFDNRKQHGTLLRELESKGLKVILPWKKKDHVPQIQP